jgi:hypothetical protein
VIDLWVKALGELLSEQAVKIDLSQDGFKNLVTVDVDNAFKFKHKGLVRTVGGLAMDLMQFNIQQLKYRIEILSGRKTDPADTWDYLLAALGDKSDTCFFILAGTFNKYDRNIPLTSKTYTKLLHRIHASFQVGIHPSYASNNKKGVLQTEISRLRKVLDTNTTISRQHYLKLRLPATYEKLIEAGIHTDYTMGYATHIGFRAGIARPFRFYNLTAEQQTPLTIVPFMAMDVTMKQYMNLSPQQAIKRIEEMAHIIAQVGGQLVTLWHNDNLSENTDWNGWREVFESVLCY